MVELTSGREAILVISLVAWLPLLVLSALDKYLLGHSVAVPFLLDLEVHGRTERLLASYICRCTSDGSIGGSESRATDRRLAGLMMRMPIA